MIGHKKSAWALKHKDTVTSSQVPWLQVPSGSFSDNNFLRNTVKARLEDKLFLRFQQTQSKEDLRYAFSWLSCPHFFHYTHLTFGRFSFCPALRYSRCTRRASCRTEREMILLPVGLGSHFFEARNGPHEGERFFGTRQRLAYRRSLGLCQLRALRTEKNPDQMINL